VHQIHNLDMDTHRRAATFVASTATLTLGIGGGGGRGMAFSHVTINYGQKGGGVEKAHSTRCRKIMQLRKTLFG